MWKSIAVDYYGESLRHLIHTLDGPSYCSGDTLAATVLLSSYELLTSPGLDHHRHVSGAVTLIKSNLYNASSGGVATAAFWVYAWQDVAMALVHECPTMLPPEQWGIPWTDQETGEDSLGNRMIWIVAKVIAHTFREVDDAATQSLHRDKTGLIKELDTWRESLPTWFAGVSFGSRSEERFLKRFFAVPSMAGAMCMYHLAHLLLLTEGCNPSIAGENVSQVEVDLHAQSVASIAFSPISHASLVQAVQPLYYSAKHISTLAVKFKIWALLDHIESQLGFHTGHRIKQLQQQIKVV
ncbi:hypothetical protein N7522_005551 [Penicillium canescens]|nr:hypothetical protein N7522_005551 [Penicillium canescens]